MSCKQKLMEILEENRGRSVSGSLLAERLGVTRSAVWKLIDALRREGYDIQASPNRGYLLSPASDRLSEAAVRPYLRTRVLGRTLSVHPSLDSTNRELKRMASAGAPHGTVVVAERQTAGRGRMGRSFYSPAQTGVYMSVLLRPTMDAHQALLITSGTAVAVARAVREVTGVETRIKWVNDLYADGKKVCGILTEAGMDFESGSFEYVVVGIGVNVLSPEEGFPRELSDVAGALCPKTPPAPLRARLIAAILNELEPICDALPDRSFLDEYRRRSLVLGRGVTVLEASGGREDATAEEIDEDGRLIVRLPSGATRVLGSGEISLRLSCPDGKGASV